MARESLRTSGASLLAFTWMSETTYTIEAATKARRFVKLKTGERETWLMPSVAVPLILQERSRRAAALTCLSNDPALRHK